MGKFMSIDGLKYEILSAGANNTCIVYGQHVAKVFDLGDSEVRREASLLARANEINSLLAKSYSVKITEDYEYELLIMERIYGLQYRAVSLNERSKMFTTLVAQVKELHTAGFAHWDIKRPEHVCSSPERLWDNIILTRKGLRLIDVGNSVTSEDPDFKDACLDDLESLKEFKAFFMIP